MKQIWIAALALAVCVVMAGCWMSPGTQPPGATTTVPIGTALPTTQVTPTAPPTTAPVPPTTIPPEPTQPPIVTGWQQAQGNTYFYLTDGTPATGWVEIEGKRYYFDDEGAMQTGLLQWQERLYYLGTEGVMITGWQEIEGKRYCFADFGPALTGWQMGEDGVMRYLLADGTMAVGWTQVGSERYYFDTDGISCTGWQEIGGKRYYLGTDGVMVTGWFAEGDREYYLRQDGSMARGHVQIEGKDFYFTSTGQQVLLVNPWNYVPEGYTPELVKIQRFGAYNNMQISAECYDALMQMLSDCKAAGFKTYIVSAYRTQEFQEKNYQRKVNDFLAKGYSEEEARILAAQVVAVPGTSEHQLGLALDIVDASWPYLENEQANMPAQQWLMEHSWEYGFILRYPQDKTDVTGIIYEPWHYRYVGKELAAELHECGLTLEEYLTALTET